MHASPARATSGHDCCLWPSRRAPWRQPAGEVWKEPGKFPERLGNVAEGQSAGCDRDAQRPCGDEIRGARSGGEALADVTQKTARLFASPAHVPGAGETEGSAQLERSRFAGAR